MTDKNFDVAVIGAGPGGYVAAIRAAQLGLKVAVIEREHLGGICLNWGCIPTKALLRSAEIYHYAQNLSSYGLSGGQIKADLAKIVERSRSVSAQLAAGVKGLLKKNKVTVFNGQASFISNTQIKIEGADSAVIEAKKIIIAAGARARILKGFEPDNKLVWSYKEAMVPTDLPESIVIIGSGAIGVEFASFYNSLGVNVTILEGQNRILPAEDSEISEFAKKAFIKQGINIITNIKLSSLTKNPNNVEVSFESEGKTQKLTADRLITAIGIVPNTETLTLANTKIKFDERGHIQTNEYMQTTEVNIYAIGDIIAGPWLAHKASHEGVMAAEHIAGHKIKPMNKKQIPGCTYSMPQIASIGLSEEKAKEAGYKVKVGKFPFLGNGKAIALGESEGLVKTIFDEKTGELLGAHMIGAEVTELIQGYAIAMQLEATEEDLFHTIFPHPTLSEMMHESVLQAYGKAIHI